MPEAVEMTACGKSCGLPTSLGNRERDSHISTAPRLLHSLSKSTQKGGLPQLSALPLLQAHSSIRKDSRKRRKPAPQTYEKLLESLTSDIDPQASNANSPVDQHVKAAAAVKKPYEFSLSTEEVAKMTGCFSGENDSVTHWLLNGVLNVMAHGAKEPDFTKLPVLKTLLLNSAPRTPVEAMLLTQMTSAHDMVMSFAVRAVSEQDSAASASYATRAERLMTLFTRQLECLQKLKGLSGQQRVVVEHLTVTAGGKAVVGQVVAPGEGCGDGK